LTRCDFNLVAASADFVRGDANDDGKVNISDASFVLGCKFLGKECPQCRDAADANDDGNVDISDAIRLLSFLFLGGAAPPPPGHLACGPDPAAGDPLPICSYQSCPSA
jgi:hypothetical protein